MYIPAVNCTEFYAAELADDATKNFFEYALDEDHFGQFFCPDLDQFDLYNYDIELDASVYSCEEAKELVYSSAYGDLECLGFDETQSRFETDPFVVSTLQITKYFNPSIYQTNSTMNYMTQNE